MQRQTNNVAKRSKLKAYSLKPNFNCDHAALVVFAQEHNRSDNKCPFGRNYVYGYFGWSFVVYN